MRTAEQLLPEMPVHSWSSRKEVLEWLRTVQREWFDEGARAVLAHLQRGSVDPAKLPGRP